MQAGDNQAGRIKLILKNPVGYLERAFKTLEFYRPSELVLILYNLKDFGSSKAKNLLDPSTDADMLLQLLPFGIFSLCLCGEDRKHLIVTLRTFGIGDLKDKTVADLMAEIELKLEKIKK